MSPQRERLLTVKEAAEITSLNPETLRRLAWQGRIRSFKILSRLRFKRGDLDKLIIERPERQPKGES
jgi:excisionase family DNA binding protein